MSNPKIRVTGTPEEELARKLKIAQQEEIENYKPQTIVAGEDDAKQLDQTGSEKKNFDEKIYLFPESFNALRRELVENWPEIWSLVSYYMGNNGPMFVEVMNAGTELKLQFDTNKVDSICKTYLNFLRNKRGISSIH